MPDKFNDLEYISENIKIQFKPDGYERLEIYRADKSKMTELFPICVGHGEMHLNISGKIIIDDEIWIVDFFNLLMDASVFSILYKKEAIFNVYDNAFYMKIFRKKRKFVIERCTSSTEISTSHVQE